MSVSRGMPWGEAAPLPEGAVLARSDGEVRAVVRAALSEGLTVPPVGLLGGDLCRTLGGRGDEARLRGDAHRFNIDLGIVTVDGQLHDWFVAHAVARRGTWWRGYSLAVMNAEYVGELDLGPRAHPGDGLLDITEGSLGWRDRRSARSRMRTGTHLPHPSLSERRVPAAEFRFEHPTPVLLDGESVGHARLLHVGVDPGALRVYI